MGSIHFWNWWLIIIPIRRLELCRHDPHVSKELTHSLQTRKSVNSRNLTFVKIKTFYCLANCCNFLDSLNINNDRLWWLNTRCLMFCVIQDTSRSSYGLRRQILAKPVLSAEREDGPIILPWRIIIQKVTSEIKCISCHLRSYLKNWQRRLCIDTDNHCWPSTELTTELRCEWCVAVCEKTLAQRICRLYVWCVYVCVCPVVFIVAHVCTLMCICWCFRECVWVSVCAGACACVFI